MYLFIAEAISFFTLVLFISAILFIIVERDRNDLDEDC